MIPFSSMLLRLTVALTLGALVGLERETREHTAGMRTNALVALGSALFTLISAYGFSELRNLPHTQLDPTRIASYVVAGIGFLGGGTIFVLQDKERVKGLTTAAAIWVVAAVGMACGAGLLLEASSATLLALVILILLRIVEQRILPHRATHHTIQIEVSETTGQLLGQLYTLCQQQHIVMEKLDIGKQQDAENGKSEQGKQDTIINMQCNVKEPAALVALMSELRALPNVQTVHATMQERKVE
ncbi:MAG: hypothetical protein NVS2B12_19230 [Ktedonobacteraceae bacterium]